MSRNQSLQRYGRYLCDLYSRCSMWFLCISTQFSAPHRTGVHTLLKIPGSTWISGQAFSPCCCNTSKSLIRAEYTEVFMCSHSQKSKRLRSGNCAGQLTGPLRPIHCWLKVWFRCSLTMQRKCGGVPSCMNHMCFYWWRGTCSKSTDKSFTKRTMLHCTC
jgi:hypothetical protein